MASGPAVPEVSEVAVPTAVGAETRASPLTPARLAGVCVGAPTAERRVAGYDTRGPCGVILRTTTAAAAGEELLQEEALIASSAAVSSANRTLWAALEKLERQRALPCSGITELGDHAAACCALRDLGVAGVRQRLLCQYSGIASGQADAKAEATVYKQLKAMQVLPQSSFAAGEYAQLLRVVHLNNFQFECDGTAAEGVEGIGRGGLGKLLFETARLANHSCEPNTDFALRWDATTSKASVRFVARRALAAGEEVTISYLGAARTAEMTRSQRRQELFKWWGFHCGCHRCKEEASDAMDSSGLADGEQPFERVPTPPPTGIEW